jgi:hypothetical protein
VPHLFLPLHILESARPLHLVGVSIATNHSKIFALLDNLIVTTVNAPLYPKLDLSAINLSIDGNITFFIFKHISYGSTFFLHVL